MFLVPIQRAPRAVFRRGGALLFLLALVALSCRKEEPAGPVLPDPAVDIRLEVGTRYVFNAWKLDRFGVRIPESLVERKWAVVAAGVSARGFGDVTLVVDSTVGSSADTLLFRIPEPGDVYQFGFLAGVLKRREEGEVPGRWDRLTAFSEGVTGQWVMGTIDSAGLTTAVARSTGDQVLFTVDVGGVNLVIPGWRIVYTAGNVDGSYWVSADGFLRFRDERFLSPAEINGDLLEITSIERP